MDQKFFPVTQLEVSGLGLKLSILVPEIMILTTYPICVYVCVFLQIAFKSLFTFVPFNPVRLCY